MTMIETLFGLIPAASTGQQWIARDLQLVNWGGYDGHHTVRFAPGATLLSGGSGSGKSTLMDAYIALLMPHTVPFNGASNGGVIGRPRGKDQRNVLSYARGKVDESRTDEGTRQRVLRGDGEDIWSAIAMTWADQGGQVFTAIRAWYVPAGARAIEELTTVRATIDGAFDLTQLGPAADAKFARARLTAAGLVCFDTDKDFTARLHSTLGIGAAGGGAKAIALLARIQAGQQITTVDALYKAMVLEEPDTLAKADEVVAHFDELSDTRERMLTARQQVRALTPIRQHRAAVDAARARLELIAQVGTPDDDTAPVALWRHERRLELLRDVEDDVRVRSRAADDKVSDLDAALRARKSELAGVREMLWASGGQQLQTAQREQAAAQDRLVAAQAARARLDRALETLGASADSAADLERLAAAGRTRLADKDARYATFADRDRARDLVRETEAALKELRLERGALAARHGNIPERLHQARVALAIAADMDPSELPFVAELIEVQTVHEPWRDAFGMALGGFATTLLIDSERIGAFRAAIDKVPSRERIRFEGVQLGLTVDVRPDANTLPGRLDYATSPFADWLRSRLVDRFSYVCVESAKEMSGYSKALTRSGQTSEGLRGAHGGSPSGSVIGFTNARRIAQLDVQIQAAERSWVIATQGLRRADEAFAQDDERKDAFKVVIETPWDQVDTVATEAEIERWTARIDELTAGNVELGPLRERAAELDDLVDELGQQLGSAKTAAAALHEEWEKITDQVDLSSRALEAADQDDDDTALDEAHAARRAYLDELLADDETPQAGAADPRAALAAFDAVAARAAERLRHDTETAERAIETGCEALSSLFEGFLRQWPDPNLGTDPDRSYAEFEQILVALEGDGLHELEEEWRRSLLRLSGDDLSDLEYALRRARSEITQRIDPVNQILAELPFADDDHRLRIEAAPVRSVALLSFQRELKELRELLSHRATEADRETRYGRMARLIDRIRREAPDFVELVDVRRHVRLSAEKIDLEGRHVALYDHIGEKSGGESQELVAFIVGAALRYQLGDADAQRPRYAPVLLDEALIKADAQFSGRAVGAWRGLGFQLVIGAPNDKVSALEPHVDASYVVLKDATGRSRAKAVVGVG
ncbi:ATP-binding protein [Microbacterium stercoris]|uniref:AAA family ATPase n=1 Tax=Microbacterium stercoris TaxID=2820289 RepID=A0A939QLA6_9MICO|nr:ATP-binding protein [Microbacterium stercoris]MBO3665002.1 AAA family ATPase [Microbacterium stercoris]